MDANSLPRRIPVHDCDLNCIPNYSGSGGISMKLPFCKPEPKQQPLTPAIPQRLSVATKQAANAGLLGSMLGKKQEPAQNTHETLAIEPPVAKVSAFKQFIKPFKEEAKSEALWLLRKLGLSTDKWEDKATVAYRKMRGWD